MTTWPGRQWTMQDDTTRYLCAATHLDSAYADEAIREFLVEPTRPIPPSPGSQAATVLVEAVAARTRRKLRDGTLAVLVALFAVAVWNSWLLYGWFALAVVLSLHRIWQRSSSTTAAAVKVAGLVLLIGLLPFVIYRELDARVVPGGAVIVGTVTAALTLVVLLADRLIVWHRLTTRFGRPARHRLLPGPFDRERPLLSLSPPRFIRHLRRYAMPAGHPTGGIPLVVHRGYNPFIGAGRHYEPRSLVLPLEKNGPDFEELSAVLLYQKIRQAMATAQAGKWPRSLQIIDAVFASSAALTDHCKQPEIKSYLPTLDGPPSPFLPFEEAGELRKQPREWARYYLCFQTEVWDGALVLSSFLHIAVDDGTLYLEWTPCVLPPIREEYQSIDKVTSGSIVPVGQALLRWFKLPVTILGRTWHTLVWFLPSRQERGVLNSDAYGSLRTLREMAAATDAASYFQAVDIERYEKLLHHRLVAAISQILRDCGYSAAEFERQTAAW